MALKEKYELGNELLDEFREIMETVIKPRDLFAFESNSLSASFATTPEEAISNKTKNIFLGGDQLEKWLKVLPQLANVEKVIIPGTAISDRLMCAVCEHRTIKRLQFDSTRLNTFDMLGELTELTHLAIGSSPRIDSLKPISKLKSLISLSIQGNFPKIHNLADIRPLTQLKGLSLCGQDYKKIKLISLADLVYLQNLEFLSLIAISVEQDGLTPVTKLPKLEILQLRHQRPSEWSKEDYEMLYQSNPRLKGSLIKRAATDEKFRKIMGIK